ncbi:ATP-binding protein [Phaeobacter italicus]|jgi:anti-sigma regulatory factor (Ser/Thr protein kinase)|uniref:ATP-binding protein n=1 Tax=Phaeobacter italicus TaxID=481446 RepID=UPI001C980FCB|nr:ATP-binding protein [Phaeobacter italicus]MBY5978179.1 ATP-binding protein [Phaeobacter italicus]
MTHWLPIADPSDISACRRLARQLAHSAGFSRDRTEEIVIVVSEAATNALRYARRGRCLLQIMPGLRGPRLAMIVHDQGPGIVSIERMMEDGASSVASAGLGLGAMRRLADRFDIFSDLDEGTTVACEFVTSRLAADDKVEIAGLLVTHPNEQRCGDGWGLAPARGGQDLSGPSDVILCDGLGHGAKAADATTELLKSFFRGRGRDVVQTLTDASSDIAGTRGAVAACLSLDGAGRSVNFASVGNISTLRARIQDTKRFATRDGRLGGLDAKPFHEQVALEPGDIVIMHTDGIRTLRDLQAKPALLMRSALLIAGKLMAENFRGRDDAGIVVCRIAREN